MKGQLVAFLQGDDVSVFDAEREVLDLFDATTPHTTDELLEHYVTELGEVEEIERRGLDYIDYKSKEFVVVNSGINGLYRAIYKI